MSAIYDNWERLVGATLRREDLKRSALRTPSDLSSASSSSFSYSFSCQSPLQVSSFNFFELISSVIKGAIASFDIEKIRKEEAIQQFPGGESFKYQKIKAAAKNFDPENKIGEHGSVSVYKGMLPDGTKIAVKSIAAKSKKYRRKFMNEIGTIYAVQHPNLVRLMGSYSKRNKLLLVYEFMENATLESAMFGSEEVKSRLDWLTRVRICRDIAKGLAFLHEESELKIIHGDVRLGNILLDKNFTAKITNFGYAQLNEGENTPLLSKVTGTMGYMPPEYMHGVLTPKTDVYSFGIVTLEIVSGMEMDNFWLNHPSIDLLDMAYGCQNQGNLMSFVDVSLGSDYTLNEAHELLNLAMECISPDHKLRPSMCEVVKVIERIVTSVELKRSTKATWSRSPSSMDYSAIANPLEAFLQSSQS